MNIREFDIIIVGAGPAGSTLVAYLEQYGYSIAVIDKSTFPRDKICGDAIPGRAVRILEAISPATKARFEAFQAKRLSKGAKAIAPSGSAFSLYFKTRGYISKRIDFDQFLFEEAQLNTNAHFFMGYQINQIQQLEDSVSIDFKDSTDQLKAKLLIGCDGANSVVARQLQGRKVNLAHHCGGVRAYYKNLNFTEEQMMEFYFLKDYLPGYFWIFQLEENWYNVGFGMLSKDIKEKQINLRKSLDTIIREVPKLQSIFKDAEQVGPVIGFGLPLGSMKRPISGNRFLLCGDAASLIDPATGEGIGNAMLSAQIASSCIPQFFEANQFDAASLKAYDKAVYDKLWRELRTKYWIQRLMKDRSRLLDFSIHLAGENPLLKKVISKIF